MHEAHRRYGQEEAIVVKMPRAVVAVAVVLAWFSGVAAAPAPAATQPFENGPRAGMPMPEGSPSERTERRLAQQQRQQQQTSPAVRLTHIDTHVHLIGPRGDFGPAAAALLRDMNRIGIQKALIMPPPQKPGQEGLYGAASLAGVIAAHPDRLALIAGGGSLNPMIQQAVAAGTATQSQKDEFRQKAEELVRMGAVAFGEMTALHLSLNPRHPFMSAPPDHALFLLLADIAAEHDMPIDLHMEAVRKDMTLGARYRSAVGVPATVRENMQAFESLLAHNRAARIVWVHAGWDNTGYRTPTYMAELLARHPNLYLSLRAFPVTGAEPSVAANRLTDESGRLRPEWKGIIEAWADRFVLGCDEFYLPPQEVHGRVHPSTGSCANTIDIVGQLSPTAAAKVSHENAERIYRLK